MKDTVEIRNVQRLGHLVETHLPRRAAFCHNVVPSVKRSTGTLRVNSQSAPVCPTKMKMKLNELYPMYTYTTLPSLRPELNNIIYLGSM
jgi:hypothetical protein